MGIIVRKSAHRLWPVTVRLNVCGEDGVVTPVAQTFVGHFTPFTEADHAAIVAEIDTVFPPPTEDAALSREKVLERNAAYFNKLMAGWGGEVAGEDGAPLAFSPAALAQLVTGPDGFAVSEALFTAVAEIRYGGAPLKNLPTSAAPADLSSAAGVETTVIAPT